MICKIVSGGQTGADRAALDVALDLGIPCGGWVPKGRLAEDGEIPVGCPHLVEEEDAEPNTRTTLNIRDSDATLILSQGKLHGGSNFTASTAHKAGKPYLHVDLAR
ncbi:MAG: putative molybdenum carrier protein [Accumulibacter sp.]|uniref:YpsA SLOG family protein n=1 Tax=Accumulibacter sp. TaxID=2053492 RepID=UPI0033164684